MVREFRESFDEVRFMPYDFKELPDGRVLVLMRAAAIAKQSGVAIEVPFAHLITIRDGLCMHFQMYSDQKRALEVTGLRESG